MNKHIRLWAHIPTQITEGFGNFWIQFGVIFLNKMHFLDLEKENSTTHKMIHGDPLVRP